MFKKRKEKPVRLVCLELLRVPFVYSEYCSPLFVISSNVLVKEEEETKTLKQSKSVVVFPLAFHQRQAQWCQCAIKVLPRLTLISERKKSTFWL